MVTMAAFAFSEDGASSEHATVSRENFRFAEHRDCDGEILSLVTSVDAQFFTVSSAKSSVPAHVSDTIDKGMSLFDQSHRKRCVYYSLIYFYALS